MTGAALRRRGFIAGLGAFSLGTVFGAIDLAPKSEFKGEPKGRRLKFASVGCGGACESTPCEKVGEFRFHNTNKGDNP